MEDRDWRFYEMFVFDPDGPRSKWRAARHGLR